MSNRAINENGMSIMLCDLCTRYPKFRNEFCKKFKHFPKKNHSNDEIKDIDYMYFSGNHDTGFGEPDITIRFTDGSFFFIEVKTKNKTKLQSNQELGKRDENGLRKGYIGLIEYLGEDVNSNYAFLVDKGHPGFETKSKKIGEEADNFSVDVIYWNDILALMEKNQQDYLEDDEKYKIKKDISVKNCSTDDNLDNPEIEIKYRFNLFIEDIKNNVDGVKNYKKNDEGISDIDFLKSPSNFKKYVDYFNNLKDTELNNNIIQYTHKNRENDEEIKFNFIFKTCSIDLPCFGWFITLEKGLEPGIETDKTNPIIKYEEKIWFGFDPYLLEDDIVVDSSNMLNIEDCVFSIGISGDLLSKDNIKNSNISYCEDRSYWFYFPLNKQSLALLINNKINLFEKEIEKQLKTIFAKCLPNDTRLINVKNGEEERQL